MKKILLIILISIIFVTGCSKEPTDLGNETKIVERTEKEQEMYDFLTTNVLTTSTLSDNRFLVFTEDGKFLRYYSSEILFPTWNNILIEAGTYEYKDSVLYLNYKVVYSQDYDKEQDKIVLTTKENIKTDQHNRFNIVEREGNNGTITYAGGYGVFRLYITEKNVPDKLSTYMKECLNNDLKDFDLEKAKSLELATKKD